MITQQVMERVVATKLREKHFLTFLKYCGEFYKEDAFINEKDFVLDVVWMGEGHSTEGCTILETYPADKILKGFDPRNYCTGNAAWDPELLG